MGVGTAMKRNWQVKVQGKPPFSMIIMEDDVDPEYVCRAVFGCRFEWVR